MIQPDYSIIWMFLAAAGAVAAFAFYEWWNRREEAPKPRRDRFLEGVNLALEGKLKEAARALTDAIHSDPENSDAYLQLGRILRRLDKPRRAAQIHLDLSLRGDLPRPLQGSVYRELARDYIALGRNEKALKYLDLSRQCDPDSTADYSIRLVALERTARWKEAGETLKKAGQGGGAFDGVKAALYKIQEGLALADAGKGHDARLIFKEALKFDSKASEAKLFIAASYIREERTDDAFEWLTAFIKERPDRAQDALPLLQALLFDLGRFGEIESLLREAFDKAPGNRGLALALIELMEKQGDYNEALEISDRSLEATPEDIPIQLKRISLLKRVGRENEAGTSLAEITEKLTSPGKGYLCSSCGTASPDLRVHCAGCGEFRTIAADEYRPLQTSE